MPICQECLSRDLIKFGKYNNKYKEIGKDEVDTKGKNFPAWCPLPDKVKEKRE